MKIDIGTARRAARISQVELSERASISRPRLSAAERNYTKLTVDELRRIRQVITAEPGRRAENIRAALPGATCAVEDIAISAL
jgi:transcriptional regulator with XRE-family HTH domain